MCDQIVFSCFKKLQVNALYIIRIHVAATAKAVCEQYCKMVFSLNVPTLLCKRQCICTFGFNLKLCTMWTFFLNVHCMDLWTCFFIVHSFFYFVCVLAQLCTIYSFMQWHLFTEESPYLNVWSVFFCPLKEHWSAFVSQEWLTHGVICLCTFYCNSQIYLNLM